jgi:hypothetical protein
MQTTRLPLGKQAPVEADCLRIEELADGRYKLTGSALCAEPEGGESVSIVGGPTFDSADAAEAAGRAWAESVGVEHLCVSVGTLSTPLETLEIDGSL